MLNRRESDAEKEPERKPERPRPKPELKYEDIDPKKYQCPDCGMKFVSERAMNIHLTTMHEKTEKDHKCVVCGKEYTSKQALDTHMKVFHGDYDPGKGLQDRVSHSSCTIMTVVFFQKNTNLKNDAIRGFYYTL